MTDHNRSIRAFIAVSIPEHIKKPLTNLQVNLQQSGISASWANSDTMHVTVKFLGNVGGTQIESIKDSMIRAVSGIPSHFLSFKGIGVFPSVKHTRVIWSGTHGQTDVLEKLVYRLDGLLFEKAGILQETRVFSSHLTLARVKYPIDPKTMLNLIHMFQGFCSQTFLVSKINLFQSELKSSGAVHKKIFSTRLDSR